MFDAVKSHGGYTIAVGDRISSSDYRLKTVVDVIDFCALYRSDRVNS